MQIKITSKLSRPAAQGFALITTMTFLAVALLIFASILYWAFSNATVTARNNQYNMSQNAAEAAVERTIGQMDRDFINLSISNATAYLTLPTTIDQSGWPVQYAFSDTNGNASQISVIFAPQSSTAVALNSQYPGLYAYAQSVDVYATATPIGQQYNVPATIHEALQFANIPLFQFAIFYNVNLEIDPGATMTITGPVFCNQNIWEGSSVCTFSSTVTAVGTNYAQVANPFACSYNGSGASTFSMAGQPVNNANSLVMPIGTNNNPNTIMGLLNLPPAAYAMGTASAYSTNGQAYPANEADLVITNFACGTNDGPLTPTGTNMFIYYQDSGLTRIPFDLYFVTNRTSHTIMQSNYVAAAFCSNVVFATYTFVTNASFYDWREGWNGGSGPAKRVEAVQVDVSKLIVWLTNTSPGISNSGYAYDAQKVLHSGHHMDSVYVYNSVPLTTSQLPAVRVANGSLLPNPGNQALPPGFSVATPFPLYVKGNYNSMNNTGSALGTTNTLHTYPSALMGDSITILSTNWSDSVTTKMPTPGSTTVNAAMLEGIVQTDLNNCGNYSGGVENFMRLLENWSGYTLTYNGSIVVLFYSQYATSSWQQTGNYYNPPTRNWAFDMNFLNAAKLPPLTPSIKAMIRGQWYAHQ
jgi:hypothetical protein